MTSQRTADRPCRRYIGWVFCGHTGVTPKIQLKRVSIFQVVPHQCPQRPVCNGPCHPITGFRSFNRSCRYNQQQQIRREPNLQANLKFEHHSLSFQIFYIYLYSVSLLFFAYCEFFLLRSIGFFNFFHIFNGFRRFLFFRPRGSRSSTITLPEPEKGESADEAYLRKRRVSMSLKRRASHSASSAGSLYLRMGCVGKPYDGVSCGSG